jgi:HAD superfamily hydrolase (TIGR01549 family)
MIKAFIFDLDGTLVQTEKLKAISYTRAALDIAPNKLTEVQVLETFRKVVGLSRQEVADQLIKLLDIKQEAEKLRAQYAQEETWQVLLYLRLQHYREIIHDSTILNEYACPYNIGLLKWASERGYKIGLGTMSHREQTKYVLEDLQIHKYFNFIATRDDVSHGKPNPEIYHLIAMKMQIVPENCLVIEDSPAGITAALDAGMHCIAVTNELTMDQVHTSGLLNSNQIVDHLPSLIDTVKSFIS